MPVIAAAIAVFVLSVELPAQSLSPGEVEAAIQAGQDRKFGDLISDCVASAGLSESFAADPPGSARRSGSFDVVLSRSAGRIALLAAEARRLDRPFTVADVSEDLRAPVVFVRVDPKTPTRIGFGATVSQLATRDEPRQSVRSAERGGVMNVGNSYQVPALIEEVVLRSKSDEEAVLEPETFETDPVEWKDLPGGVVKGNRATATFSLDGVQGLPPGEFDIVVVTEAGERRCKVGGRDRRRLFP